MNILILTTHFNEGGISRYCLSLSAELKKRGHNVYVASSGGNLVKELAQNNVEHIELDVRTKSELSLKIWCALKPIKKLLKEKDIQLIHAQTRVTQVLAFWIYKFYKIPFVSTCHGFFKPRLSRKIFPCWGKKVIAISRAVREHLINDLLVNPDEVVSIRNGLDLTKFPQYDSQTKQDLKNKLKINPEGPVIGIISRLSSVKGHKFLMQAMTEVLKEFPQAQLLIVGDGSLKDELVKLTEELKIAEQVIFVPAVSDTSLLLSIMDIFVMPSLQEGLGLSIMEAMASSVPVIATCVGGIPDLIRDNQTGILVPPQDSPALSQAIIRLIKDTQLRNILSETARRFIEAEFTLEKMVKETERLYRFILAQK